MPEPLDPFTVLTYPPSIPGDTEVGEVALQLLGKFGLLLGKRAVAVDPTPLANSLEPPIETRACRFPFDDPFAFLRPPPIVGEAQKVEGPRTLSIGTLRSPEGHQTRLVRVERQPILCEAFTEHPQHPFCILLILEAHDHVVSEANHEGTTPHARLHLGGKPLVEHIVEVDVAEQR